MALWHPHWPLEDLPALHPRKGYIGPIAERADPGYLWERYKEGVRKGGIPGPSIGGFFWAPAAVRHLSARALVSQHGVPKSGLWKPFSGAPTAAKAAVGYLSAPSPCRRAQKALRRSWGGGQVEVDEAGEDPPVREALHLLTPYPAPGGAWGGGKAGVVELVAL